MKKRFLTAMLAAVMLLCLLPAAAFALDVTAAPATASANAAVAKKTNIVQTSISYTLSNGASYTAQTVFQLYADETRAVRVAGITATLSGNTLTLSHATNLPVGKLYLTATESGKAESAALELTIKVDTGKIVFLLTSEGLYYGDAASVKTYYEEQGHTVAQVTAITRGSLDGASLAVLWLPEDAFNSEALAELQALLDSGGRVFMIGEYTDVAGAQNERLTAAAKALGGDFEIQGGTYNGISSTRENGMLMDCDLTEGVTEFWNGTVAPISAKGSVQNIAYLEDSSVRYLYAVDQAAGNGRITAIADINGIINTSALSMCKFLDNLISCSIAGQTAVMAGSDPNEGFAGCPTFTVSAPSVYSSGVGGAAYSFTVTYKSGDNNLFDEATVGTDDVTVQKSGVNTPLPVTAAAVTAGSNSTAITVTYTVTPPGGSWDAPDNGTYVISVKNAAVTTKTSNKQSGAKTPLAASRWIWLPPRPRRWSSLRDNRRI